MNKYLLLLALAAMVGCSDDDGEEIKNQAAESTFYSMYPEAKNVQWELKNSYFVAEFQTQSSAENEAWFDVNGVWYMTESDITESQLPAVIKSALESGEYADWRVDDIDLLSRKGVETLYVIEVEKSNSERALYYTESGELIKTVVGQNDEYEPMSLSSTITNTIAQKYPSAKILDFDSEPLYIEVDINDGGTIREVYFDLQDNWLRTETEINVSDVPQVVKQAVAANGYDGWQIDDAKFIQNPLMDYYLLEVEKGNDKDILSISETGELVN